MFPSAFGSLGHFRESFDNFARLLKLPLLTSYKDQVLIAGRLCSEFCNTGGCVQFVAMCSLQQQKAFWTFAKKSKVY